jgi:hypothetical protein
MNTTTIIATVSAITITLNFLAAFHGFNTEFKHTPKHIGAVA